MTRISSVPDPAGSMPLARHWIARASSWAIALLALIGINLPVTAASTGEKEPDRVGLEARVEAVRNALDKGQAPYEEPKIGDRTLQWINWPNWNNWNNWPNWGNWNNY
jgi:hypothetical protein